MGARGSTGGAAACLRHDRRRKKGVGDAAMVLQLLHRPGQGPQNVDVGGFGGQNGGERGVGGLAIEARAADAGSGKKMGDRLHGLMPSIQ